MAGPKGKTPCLIGTTLGACSFVYPGSRGSLRKCARCHESLERDAICIQVTIPGSMGHKTFCRSCFGLILDATQRKIEELRGELAGTAS